MMRVSCCCSDRDQCVALFRRRGRGTHSRKKRRKSAREDENIKVQSGFMMAYILIDDEFVVVQTDIITAALLRMRKRRRRGRRGRVHEKMKIYQIAVGLYSVYINYY